MGLRIGLSAMCCVLIGQAALADDLVSASEVLLDCRSIPEATAKLACFETAAKSIDEILAHRDTGTRINQVNAAPYVAAPLPTAPSVESRSTPSQAIASNVTPQTSEPTTIASTPAQASSQETVQAEVAADSIPNRSLLPSWVPKVSLKFNDKDAVEEPDFFATEITRIQRNRLGRHFFTTRDGQVWRQIRIEEIQAPSTLPAPAIIRQTLSGAIRIEISETDRSYNVYRIE